MSDTVKEPCGAISSPSCASFWASVVSSDHGMTPGFTAGSGVASLVTDGKVISVSPWNSATVPVTRTLSPTVT
ncbi:hypothetical protein AB0M46_43930 [Dactylosporangium sp. NPDC051485]|uniref:hypothetical protein n=1 Tax=Dactylosporangium sp. NPDC051485 TaxID=3154846 RepID=UPI00343BCDD6